MKCLFINPRSAEFYAGLSPDQIPRIKQTLSRSRTLQTRIEFSRYAFSGLGLLTTAAVARRAVPEIEIDFLDENVAPDSELQQLELSHDLVVLGGTVNQMNRMHTLVLSARSKGIQVVVGGAAAMTFPEFFRRDGVSVILGESETLFPAFLRDFQEGAPRPVYEKTDGSGVDLTDSPVPDFSLIAHYEYTFIGVQTTRGCPFRCEFCQVSNWLGTELRHKDVTHIVEEVRQVKSIWPNAFFFFYDDNLFSDRRFATALFDALTAADIHLGRWGANSDATVFREDQLLDRALGRGQLDYLGIGFESMSSGSLASIGNPGKAGLRESYGEIVETLINKNIGVFGYFMFGFENSRPRDLAEIVEFILSHGINAQISQLVPMPGTPLYHRLAREYEEKCGTIRKGPMGTWRLLRNFLVEKTGMTQPEMTHLLAEAYDRIYDDARPVNRTIVPAPSL